MKRITLAMLILALCQSLPLDAQGAVGTLLAQVNDLRARNGLPAYTLDSALNAAARNHAGWMASNNRVAHQQSDGSNARTRARQAGFPSSWVGENIYMGPGASPATAWNWWLNSPVHYAGLVSPNYDRVGIGSATTAGRTAYVMVFGNSAGALSQAESGAAAGSSSNVSQPPYVLGLDARGNIRHEVQPGHTIGDIALIYGYTWDDIPAMLELNDMTWDDIRWLQPGSEFLVPPQDGTYTPTAPPSATPPATATPEAATASPTIQPSLTLKASQAPALATPESTRQLRIEAGRAISTQAETQPDTTNRLLLLAVAALVQLFVIGGAAFALLRDARQA